MTWINEHRFDSQLVFECGSDEQMDLVVEELLLAVDLFSGSVNLSRIVAEDLQFFVQSLIRLDRSANLKVAYQGIISKVSVRTNLTALLATEISLVGRSFCS
jgi:hypothetical protein